MPLPFHLNRMDSEHLGQPPVDEDELGVLRKIVEGTAHETGRDFFKTLVEQLALATHTRGAFVAEFCGPERVRAVAMLWQGKWIDDFEWDLDATPCKEVLGGKLCHFPSGVSKQFPKEEGVESYLGVPLIGSNGKTMGHMAVIDDKEMPAEPRKLYIFRIFAARAASELSRLEPISLLPSAIASDRIIYLLI